MSGWKLADTLSKGFLPQLVSPPQPNIQQEKLELWSQATFSARCPAWHWCCLSHHHSFCCLLQKRELSSLSCHQYSSFLFAVCKSSNRTWNRLLLIHNGDCVWGCTQPLLMLSYCSGHCEAHCIKVSLHMKSGWREVIMGLLSSWAEKIRLMYAVTGHTRKWDKAPPSKESLCEH